MKRASAKIKSNSGASMIIALLFLLLCLTVGAIILSAASSSAGRLVTARTNQQNYLTVSSAADLLRDKISGLKFTGVEKSIYSSYSGGTSQPTPTYTYSQNDPLPTLVGNKAAAVFKLQSAFNPSGILPPAVPLKIESESRVFSDVTANMQIQEDYSLKITLSLSASPSSYSLTLLIPASVTPSTVIDISQDPKTDPATGVTTMHTKTTITHTVIVTWGVGVISSGS